MRFYTRHAGALALAAMFGFTIIGAAGSGAFAQDTLPGESLSEPDEAAATGSQLRFIAEEVVQALPGDEQSDSASEAASLEELVAAISTEGELSSDLHCLAGAIYFESRGEPLTGQLAVGEVVVNRAESGRFPASYCGVVYQRGQFSFVRSGRMPAINTASDAWRHARAIARIAHEGLWESPAEGALFFHATHVKPRWRLTRVGQVNRHIFYR